jgi:hypothetical protein
MWKRFDEHSLNCWWCMYSSGKHSIFLYNLTNFDAISHIAVILSFTNVLKIRQGSVISFVRYDRGSTSVSPAPCGIRSREGGFAPAQRAIFSTCLHSPSTIFAASLVSLVQLSDRSEGQYFADFTWNLFFLHSGIFVQWFYRLSDSTFPELCNRPEWHGSR